MVSGADTERWNESERDGHFREKAINVVFSTRKRGSFAKVEWHSWYNDRNNEHVALTLTLTLN